MKKVILGVMLLAGSAFAQESTTKIDQQDLMKEEKSPFSGTFDISAGYDNNAMVSKIGEGGSFFLVSPTLNYSKGIFNSSVSASIKDYNDQNLSNNAKETSAALNLGLSTKLFGDTSSNTNVSYSYSDSRWPDFFNVSTPNTYFLFPGMPVKYNEAKISQSLGWNIDRLNLKAAGSFAKRDYTSKYSNFVSDILGPLQFQNDQTIATASLAVAVKLSDALEIAATPSVSQKKYDERPARETDGSKGGSIANAPMTEFITNDLRAELRINAGIVSVTPYVATGVQMDQATGGEDFKQTGGGVEASLKIADSINLKLSGAYNMTKISYDNWTNNLFPGNTKRVDDESSSNVKLSMDVTKSVGLSLGYDNITEDSNLNDTDEIYVEEIYTTNISIRF